MDNNTPSTPARRPIVRVIDALTNADGKISNEVIDEIEVAQVHLKGAACEQFKGRVERLTGLLNIVSAEMNDIREQLVGIARAEAKMKARPEGA